MTQESIPAAGSEQTLRGTAKRTARGRWQLVALVAIFAAPVLLARLWVPSGQINHGDLVAPPVPLPDYSFIDAQGQPFSLAALRHQWLLVVSVGNECDSTCEKNLYKIRQVRLAKGKHAKRIQSLLITRVRLPDAQLERYRNADPNLIILNAAGAAADPVKDLKQLALDADTPSVDGNGVYMIDPLGNLMMHYAVNFEPKSMVKDLGRLLRASRVG